MKTLRAFTFLLFTFYFCLDLYAQAIPTCSAALAAKPQGPFPCSVVAAWQDNSNNETGFILQRRLNGGPWAALGGVLGVNVTSVVDATLQQSATVDNVYEYQVSATNSAGQSPPSNVAGFTVTKAVTVPVPASSLTITFKGANGQMDCPTCAGGDKKVPLTNADGTVVITSATEITMVYK